MISKTYVPYMCGIWTTYFCGLEDVLLGFRTLISGSWHSQVGAGGLFLRLAKFISGFKNFWGLQDLSLGLRRLISGV